jgi:hypothetical protein
MGKEIDKMGSRKNLILNLMESNHKKSPEGNAAPSGKGQLSDDMPKNEEKPGSHRPKVSGGGKEKEGLGLTQGWSDKAQLYDLIVQNRPQEISIVTSADEDQQIDEQLTDSEGVRLSADNHYYGELVIGTFQEFVLTIFNASNVPLTIERIEGLPSKEFKLSTPPVLPVTLPPNGSQFLTVIFIPLNEGKKNLTFSIAVKNHQQRLFNVSLSGTAVKGYLLPPDVINLRGFRKLISFAKLGRGEVCPCCDQGEVARRKPRVWMRLIPGSQHFECWVCGARFLTIGNRGKILFKGSNI